MGEVIQSLVTDVGLPIIGAVVSILAGVAVKKVCNLLDWKAEREYCDEIEKIAAKAIMASKSRVRRRAKQQGKEMDEDSVISEALKMVEKSAPKLSEEQARQAVESALEMIGLDVSDSNRDESNK